MNCYNVSLHGFFYLFLWMFFFQNGLCRFYFFYIELVENFVSYVLKKNTMDCYNVSPHDFCFAIMFSHLFFFKIILALTFPTCFISHFFSFFFLLFFPQNYLLLFSFFFFFCVFFSELFLSILFFNIELVENLAL